MWKQKKYLIPALLLIVIILAHFMPVYSRTGVLDNNPGRSCIDYLGVRDDYYRIIPYGLSGFSHDKAIFNPPKPRGVCEEPVTLRLYLW